MEAMASRSTVCSICCISRAMDSGRLAAASNDRMRAEIRKARERRKTSVGSTSPPRDYLMCKPAHAGRLGGATAGPRGWARLAPCTLRYLLPGTGDAWPEPRHRGSSSPAGHPLSSSEGTRICIRVVQLSISQYRPVQQRGE